MKVPDTLQDWCASSYTELNFRGFDMKKQRFFRKASLLSGFLDFKNLRGEGKLKNLFFFLVAGFARLRIRLGIYSLTPEAFIIRHRKRGAKSP